MYILKNAWISIKRNKARNILIGIIMLIIACACTIALAIQSTATNLIDSYKNAYEKEVTISFDRENLMKDFNPATAGSKDDIREKFNNVADYTVSDIENFANSDLVDNYYYTYSVGLDGDGLEKAELETQTNNQAGQNSQTDQKAPDLPNDRGGHGMEEEFSSSDFTLTGYSSADAMSEFMSGTYTMSEIADDAWDKAFSGNYVFLNQELADYNNLKLNDTIKLKDDSGNTYDFEIIGIFEENEEEPGSKSPFSNSANKIITNAAAVSKIAEGNSSLSTSVTPTFIIDSYDDVDTLQAEFYAKGLDSNYILTTNEAEATAAVSNIESLNSFATTFLIVTLVIGGIVLFVINMINIRERKYEIGVLRTIGMSKGKLTLQFVAELSIISFVALVIGAGLGALSSAPISNLILSSEISSSSERAAEIDKNFGRGGPAGEASNPGNPSNNASTPENSDFKGDLRGHGVPVIQAYDSIDAVVDAKVLLELLAVAIVLVLISSIASMVSIQRFSPLTILKERS